MTDTAAVRTRTALNAEAVLTLTEVADLLGRDITTVKKWNRAERWPGAVQDPDGRRAWRVPVHALVAAGDLDPAQVSYVKTTLTSRRESRQMQELREQVARLEEQLNAANALATERAATIELLSSLLTSGRTA